MSKELASWPEDFGKDRSITWEHWSELPIRSGRFFAKSSLVSMVDYNELQGLAVIIKLKTYLAFSPELNLINPVWFGFCVVCHHLCLYVILNGNVNSENPWLLSFYAGLFKVKCWKKIWWISDYIVPVWLSLLQPPCVIKWLSLYAQLRTTVLI